MTDEIKQARKIIGERIKRYREHLGMTQEDLAVKIGYTGNNPNITISKVENGIRASQGIDCLIMQRHYVLILLCL